MELTGRLLNPNEGSPSVYEGVIFEVHLKESYRYGNMCRSVLYFISTTIQRVMYCLHSMGIQDENIARVEETDEIKGDKLRPHEPNMFYTGTRVRGPRQQAEKCLVFIDSQALTRHYTTVILEEATPFGTNTFTAPNIPLERYGIVEPVRVNDSTDARHADVVRTTITSLDEDLF